MKDFHDLKVWEKAHALALAVYEASGTFPRHELFGLTSQVRRSAYSVPANIAEGCGRGTDSDFARFLQMAMGSASETEYHLLLAKDLRLLEAGTHRRLNLQITEIKRMLAALIRTARRHPRPHEPEDMERCDNEPGL